MQKSRARKLIATIIALFFCMALVTGCAPSSAYTDKDDELIGNGTLSVNYIDVGQGDCIFIYLPDGQTVLIDTGVENSAVYRNIKTVIKGYGVTHLNYLVLTHADSNHVGNLETLFTDFTVGKALLPAITNLRLFPAYTQAINIITKNADMVEYFNDRTQIVGECFISFLSPQPTYCIDSFINQLNQSLEPDERLVNNSSAVIYLQYKDKRFLFAGDASSEVENKIMELYELSCFEEFVKLKDIDFLKVAHHGDSGASSKDFLKLLKPKNAIISVGANNRFNQPSTVTLSRLNEIGSNLFRTDVLGNIAVNVNDAGAYKIQTQKTN